MMVLHVAKKAVNTSNQMPVLRITHGRAHSPHVFAPAHIHAAHTIAHAIPTAQALPIVFIHSTPSLIVRCPWPGLSPYFVSRVIAMRRLSLNWRPRAHLASNAALWSSLSGESLIDRRNPMQFGLKKMAIQTLINMQLTTWKYWKVSGRVQVFGVLTGIKMCCEERECSHPMTRPRDNVLTNAFLDFIGMIIPMHKGIDEKVTFSISFRDHEEEKGR
jgi:hypothetical protein